MGPQVGHITKLGTNLSLDQEKELAAFLERNEHVFAWSSVDLEGMDPDFICHRLALHRGSVGLERKSGKSLSMRLTDL